MALKERIVEVFCLLKVEGIHFWGAAPKEVSYLADEHRHLFHIKAHVTVSHSDRDVEFIMLKHSIQDYLTVKYYDANRKLLNFGSMSCEMIASELSDSFDLIRCEVSEDGENGAIVTTKNI